MSRLPPAVYSWTPGTITPSIPWVEPNVQLPDVPDQPGYQGEEWMVAVGPFPAVGRPTPLFGARITDIEIPDRRVGPNRVTVKVPATPVAMRILGLQYDSFDSEGRHLYGVDDAIKWELFIGSTLAGGTQYRMVVRDQVQVADGMVTITGVGTVGGLTASRIIGAPERVNLLDDRIGSFESGTLRGWTEHGGIVAQVVPGGVDGRYCVRVKGDPTNRGCYLERKVPYSQPPQPWGRQAIAASAYVRLPAAGLDIDDYGLVTVGVHFADSGAPYWPRTGPLGSDPYAAVVDGDMVRGSFTRDPVVALGFLPPPPFSVDVSVRLHPTSEDHWTYYDADEIIRRESSSTKTPKDLTRHVRVLFDHAQRGRDKSDWKVRVEYGASVGIVETGTWYHDVRQSMDEALEALCGRGMDVWDRPGPGRVVRTAKRRGSRRRDLQVHEWDALGSVSWVIDPGAQRTAVGATSGAGSIWGGADEGAIDTSDSGGQVIDVTVSAPTGMSPSQLKRWVKTQLGTYKLLQTTATLLLPMPLGRRIVTGDSIYVAVRHGSVPLLGWFQVTNWKPDLDGQFVAVDIGVDPELVGVGW